MPKIPASERDAFYEARRAELAGVALKLWAKQGFDQTSVQAIAREAGVSKGTFYLYFDSKDALLEDVLRRNSLVPQVRALVEDLAHRPLEEAVRGFVRGAWRHLGAHRELVLVLLRELPTHLEEAASLIERVMLPANQLLAHYLEARIPPERAEKLSLVVAGRSLLGMVVFLFLTQEVLGAARVLPLSEEEICDTLTELFLRGIHPDAPTEAEPC